MDHEYTLDALAENATPYERPWMAARMLGKHIVDHMRADHISTPDAYYYLDGLDDVLQEADTPLQEVGEAVVSLYNGDGTWLLNRKRIRSYHERSLALKFPGDYLGFQVEAANDPKPLFRVALPLTYMTGRLLGGGFAETYSYLSRQKGILERYDEGDLADEPQRIQKAAEIFRRIVRRNIQPGRGTTMTPEEEEAFLDKHFPYQDLPVTGGGGRTVRRRAMRPLIPGPNAPEDLSGSTIKRPAADLELPE